VALAHQIDAAVIQIQLDLELRVPNQKPDEANRPPGRLNSRSRKLYLTHCAPESTDFGGICATTTLFHGAPEPAAAALPGIKL
jgi:hypothetical protein